MKSLRILYATLVFVAMAFAAKPTAILGPGMGSASFRVPYRVKVNRVLSSDTTYILTGWYFIDSTYSLTIPAGTLIRGDSASGGTLIISRGAKIHAIGTKARPIIFTSNKPSGTRVPGDWGGVILLGAAPINQPTTTQIEGGFNTIPGAEAMYGGADSADNSGECEYMRIEFAGIAFSQDNEINGMTFGGVGAGTTIDHVQVSYANDDDYEFFGGTVQVKHLVSWRELDDTYDTDEGFSGRMQFCFAKRDPLIFDASPPGASNGFESDNEGNSPFSSYPRTKARVSNITEIGPQSDTNVVVNSHWGNLALLRRATEFSIYNSVLVGWPNPINIRDTLTQRAAIDNRLEIRNTSICGKYGNLITASSSPSTGNISGFDPVAWFNGNAPYTATGNLGGTAGRDPSDVGFRPEAFHLDWTINPVPLSTSELATAGTSYQGRLTGDSWYDSVSYRGAFDPSKARDQQWDWGWTNYDPENYDPEAPVTGLPYAVNDGWNLLSLPIKNTVSTASVFPTSTSDAFGYSGGYVSESNISNGNGYWVKFNGSQSFSTVVGINNLADTFTVSDRWNLIGSLSAPIPVTAIVSNPGGNISSNYFGYNDGYTAADTLYPGKGYWVKTTTNGQLYLDVSHSASSSKTTAQSSLSLEGMNRLVVTDAHNHTQNLYFTEEAKRKVSLSNFELPPIPPSNGFDARFTTQRYVDVGSQYTVSLQGSYPMSISFSGAGSTNRSYEIDEMQDGSNVASHSIDGKSKVVITDAKTATIVVKVLGTGTRPSQYSLSQNYPNPFNPSTVINYNLLQNSQVSLKVFNALGQEVATLVNGMQDAGFKSVTFDASNLPSGMYFYKLVTGQFNETKKMVIVK